MFDQRQYKISDFLIHG